MLIESTLLKWVKESGCTWKIFCYSQSCLSFFERIWAAGSDERDLMASVFFFIISNFCISIHFESFLKKFDNLS